HRRRGNALRIDRARAAEPRRTARRRPDRPGRNLFETGTREVRHRAPCGWGGCGGNVTDRVRRPRLRYGRWRTARELGSVFFERESGDRAEVVHLHTPGLFINFQDLYFSFPLSFSEDERLRFGRLPRLGRGLVTAERPLVPQNGRYAGKRDFWGR